jgi:hypothetical protein
MLKTNKYFDGNVKSIAFQSETLPASVGVMAKGQYVFNAADKEKMTVISGALTIQFPNSDTSQTYNAGESFDVPANSSFNVSVASDTSYLCLYG